MKVVGILSAILVCFLSSQTFADVYLKLDDGIRLLAINGKKAVDTRWLDNKKNISFKDGANQILVEFSVEVKTSPNETDLESSGVYVIVFEGSSEYLRLLLPTIKNKRDFAQFKKDPEWVMLDASGVMKSILVDELTKEGFQLSRDYESELREYNTLKYPSENYFKKNNQTAIKTSSSINKSSVLNSPNLPRKMLKYWYLNASLEVQTEFIEWTKK